MQPCVYILARKKNGTLYVGVTSDIVKRIWQHKNDFVESFTKARAVHHLVYFELHATMESAISCEKNIKAWKRAWKIELIGKANLKWQDLYADLL